MSSTPSHTIHTRTYIDHSRQWGFQTQWLRTDTDTRILTNLFAVIVTIALARLFVLLLAFLRRHEAPDEARPQAPETLSLDSIIEAHEEGGRVQGLDDSSRRYGKRFWKASAKAVFFGLTYIGFLVCGIFTAYLASDGKALSTHPDCGIYAAPSNSSPKDDLIGPYAFRAQLDSAQLASSCYHATKGADGCNFFVDKAIRHTNRSVDCPFADGMCKSDEALHFTTGPISAAAVGIRTPRSFEFKRDTTCAPLNGNSTFITVREHDGVSTQTYHYGSRGVGYPWTWQNDLYAGILDLQAHDLVDVVISSGGYQPIPSLRVPPTSTLTLLFIHAQKISYTAESSDPIFPAHNTFTLPSFPTTTFWRNLDRRSAALACIDTTLWRERRHWSTEWQPFPPAASAAQRYANDGAFLLLNASLTFSNIFNTIDYRLGSGLNAQGLVRGWKSLPLAKEQWKVEARQLFETSLARIQIEARNIARGAGAAYEKLERRQDDRKMLCEGTYMFRSQGWQNLNVTGMAWLAGLTVVIVLFALPGTKDRLFVQILWEGLRRFVMVGIPWFFTEKVPEWARAARDGGARVFAPNSIR